MNLNSELYEARLPHIEDDKHHQELRGSVLNLENRIEAGTRIVSKAKHLLVGTAVLVLSFFPVVKLCISELHEIDKLLRPFDSQLSSVPSESKESSGPDQTHNPELVATNQLADDTLSVINNVKLSSHSTFPRTTRGQHPSSARTDSRTSPAVESRGQKTIAPFTLPIGIPVTFREEGGVVRPRELPSLPTVPGSWGNGPAIQR